MSILLVAQPGNFAGSTMRTKIYFLPLFSLSPFTQQFWLVRLLELVNSASKEMRDTANLYNP